MMHAALRIVERLACLLNEITSQTVIIAAIIEVGRVDAAVSPRRSYVSKVYALIDYEMMMHRFFTIFGDSYIFKFQACFFIFFSHGQEKSREVFFGSFGVERSVLRAVGEDEVVIVGFKVGVD